MLRDFRVSEPAPGHVLGHLDEAVQLFRDDLVDDAGEQFAALLGRFAAGIFEVRQVAAQARPGVVQRGIVAVRRG